MGCSRNIGERRDGAIVWAEAGGWGLSGRSCILGDPSGDTLARSSSEVVIPIPK